MALKSLISKFQHFEVKVGSKSMDLFWIFEFVSISEWHLFLKKTKVLNSLEKSKSEVHSIYFITQFMWNYSMQWFTLIRTTETSTEGVLEKKCL